MNGLAYMSTLALIQLITVTLDYHAYNFDDSNKFSFNFLEEIIRNERVTVA